MAWIELHQELRCHPKIVRLASILGISSAEATGNVVNLWLWAVSYARDGNIAGFTPAEVGLACDSKSEKMLDALIETGWVDVRGEKKMLHDWKKHGLRLLKSNQERVRKHRQAKRLQGEGETLQRITVMPTNLTNHTIPNQPNQTTTTPEVVVVSSPDDGKDLEQYLLQQWGVKGRVSYANKAEFVKLFGEYGRENVLDAIALAAKAGVDKMSIRYVLGILKRKGAEQKQIHAKQSVETYVCICGERVNENLRATHTEECDKCPLPDVDQQNADADEAYRQMGRERKTKFVLEGRRMVSVPIQEDK